MAGFLRVAKSYFSFLYSAEEQKVRRAFRSVTGFYPVNLSLYQLAMRHSSTAPVNVKGFRESNERLEYLGDAILGMIVAEWLFTKFPFKEEGFLTEIRAKIVNREALNMVSRKIGLKDLIEFQRTSRAGSPKSIYGDSLEALIGAIYLDKGYNKSRNFVIKKLLIPHYDLELLVNTISNFKSKIIEWAQKENKDLTFEVEESEDPANKQFIAQVIIDDESFEKGHGLSKKKAEQDAARRTIEKLDLNIP